jgi:hypothetical protein
VGEEVSGDEAEGAVLNLVSDDRKFKMDSNRRSGSSERCAGSILITVPKPNRRHSSIAIRANGAASEKLSISQESTSSSTTRMRFFGESIWRLTLVLLTIWRGLRNELFWTTEAFWFVDSELSVQYWTRADI